MYLLSRLPKDRLARATFVVLNVSLSLMSFVRSYLLLRYLDFYELGLISIFQTVILLIGMIQFGVLNGSYRAYSGADLKHPEKINNFTFTFFILIGGITTIFFCAYTWYTEALERNILLLGTVAGVLSLIATYLNNTLLARQRIAQVNYINFISNAIAYLSLVLIIYNPILALISFILQPLLYIILAFFLDRSLIPRRLVFSLSILKYLLLLGFVPYLVSLFAYLNLQIERWTIVLSNGVDQFGHYYLAIAFVTLFGLFPASLNNLYFPRIVRASTEKASSEFTLLLKRYTYILVAYCIGTSLLTIVAAPPLVSMLFPQHTINLPYVYNILPGAVAIILVNPCVVYFNSLLVFRPLWISYACGTLTIVVIISALLLMKAVSLQSVSITNSAANLVIAVMILIFYFLNRNSRQSEKGHLLEAKT